MAGRSRKKIEKDDFIVKDLGVNKDNKVNVKKIPKLKYAALFTFILLLIMTAIFAIRFINFGVAEMMWKTSVTRGSDNINNKSIKYESFKNGLLRVSNDGITYINSVGDVRWTISYNMKDTICESSENYFAIANRNGYEFYIFDENGVSGKNTVKNPIQKISMSNDGILYILQSDDENSYINVFRSNGENVDVSFKTTLTGEGMAIDIGVSDDGTEMVIDYVCLKDEEIYSKATYYNFSEVGQNTNTKKVVGDFVDEFNDKFLGRVYFFDNEKSFLLYDGGVYFVSTKNQESPIITQKKEYDSKIRSISYNKKYLAIVFEDNKMVMYNKDGMLLADKRIDFDYEKFYISEDYAVFLYSNRVMIYDKRGRMIFDKEMDFEVQYVAKKKSLLFTELLLGLIDGVECIRFY